MAKRKSKKKGPPRDPAEVAQDRHRVLRRAGDIERAHWMSGCAPGECPTCNVPAADPDRPAAGGEHYAALAAQYGGSPEAFLAGWQQASRNAAAAAVQVEAHPALLEREDDGLDLVGFGDTAVVEDED